MGKCCTALQGVVETLGRDVLSGADAVTIENLIDGLLQYGITSLSLCTLL